MPVATVTVDFVNEPKPGKKFGSIKTKELAYVSVKPEDLNKFTKGSQYQIEYTETAEGYKNFVRVVGTSSTAPKNGSHNGEQSRYIFITGVVGRAVGSGNVPPGQVADWVIAAADAWEALRRYDNEPPPAEPPY